MTTDDRLKQVEEFWDHNLCGNQFIKEDYLSAKFYEEYRFFRYQKEHHLLKYIDWKSAVGKDVLEIGLGVGADGTMWARNAKSYTGIDLTNEAVEATEKHLKLLNLKGNIVKGNAEHMPFNDKQFDLVYSHGVLHHTDTIENTFNEVNRVLKSNGKIILMLYSKSSFNYWVRILLYLRLRLLVEIFKSKIGLKTENNYWKLHLNNFNKKGWKYFSKSVFPHHCTDGPECEIANIYYTQTIVKLLNNHGFKVTATKKAHFPFSGGKFPNLELQISKWLGFYQFYWADKV